MAAMSIIVIVIGVWFVFMGLMGNIIHSRRANELTDMAKEDGLIWKRVELESAIKQLRDERSGLRLASKEGTVEWVENFSKLTKATSYWFFLGLLVYYFKLLNISLSVLGIALILIGIVQL